MHSGQSPFLRHRPPLALVSVRPRRTCFHAVVIPVAPSRRQLSAEYQHWLDVDYDVDSVRPTEQVDPMGLGERPGHCRVASFRHPTVGLNPPQQLLKRDSHQTVPNLPHGYRPGPGSLVYEAERDSQVVGGFCHGE